MREIKFRAWDTIEKEMRAVTDLRLPIYNVVDEFMQYTGLKDKNGVEIYEGDIVLAKEEKYVVYFEPRLTGYRLYPTMFWNDLKSVSLGDGVRLNGEPAATSKQEVIGNIYENPELLTQSRTQT